MALIVLIVTISLIVFVTFSLVKKTGVSKSVLAMSSYLIVGFVILLVFLIPNKLNAIMNQAKIEMEVTSEMPTVPNIILVNVNPDGLYILTKPDGKMSDIEFYLVEYNEEKFVENALVKELNEVKQDQNLVIRAIVPEGVPNLKMKWLNKDYISGELIISYNGKDGGINNNPTYKHTWKSVLMSLLK